MVGARVWAAPLVNSSCHFSQSAWELAVWTQRAESSASAQRTSGKGTRRRPAHRNHPMHTWAREAGALGPRGAASPFASTLPHSSTVPQMAAGSGASQALPFPAAVLTHQKTELQRGGRCSPSPRGDVVPLGHRPQTDLTPLHSSARGGRLRYNRSAAGGEALIKSKLSFPLFRQTLPRSTLRSAGSHPLACKNLVPCRFPSTALPDTARRGRLASSQAATSFRLSGKALLGVKSLNSLPLPFPGSPSHFTSHSQHPHILQRFSVQTCPSIH